jgi:NAD(P)H-dependent flavin oxidoreductase YrpB (nitropropane dioxygenase family)
MGCGQAVGLIREIKSVAEIIKDVTEQAAEIAGKLGSIFQERKKGPRV